MESGEERREQEVGMKQNKMSGLKNKNKTNQGD